MVKSANKKLQSANASAHSNKLSKIAQAINTKIGAGTIILGNQNIVKVEAIPTGIASLDVALGLGGLPRGRLIEIYGAESSGKTTTTLQIIANCQHTYFDKYQRNGVTAFIDAEHALDPVWAEKIGVDMNSLFFHQPDTGEQAFQVLEELARTNEVDLVVIDSLASLIPKEEIEGELDEQQVGAQARMVSKALRRIKGVVNSGNCAAIFVNQIRNKIGVKFGSPEETPGGKSLKYYASVRIDMRTGAPIQEGGKAAKSDGPVSTIDAIGRVAKVKIVKNKIARPFRSCEYSIYFGTSPGGEHQPIFGVDTVGSLFEAANELGIITLAGSNFNFGETRLGAGRVKAITSIRESEELRKSIHTAIFSNLGAASKDVSVLDADELLDHLDSVDGGKDVIEDASDPI